MRFTQVEIGRGRRKNINAKAQSIKESRKEKIIKKMFFFAPFFTSLRLA